MGEPAASSKSSAKRSGKRVVRARAHRRHR
jgi:hypothetical protein